MSVEDLVEMPIGQLEMLIRGIYYEWQYMMCNYPQFQIKQGLNHDQIMVLMMGYLRYVKIEQYKNLYQILALEFKQAIELL